MQSVTRIVIGMVCLIALLSTGAIHKTQKVVAFVGGGCVLGEDNGEIWINLFQENPQGGMGKQVWNDVHFNKGDSVQVPDNIVPSNLKMRYNYKNVPDDPYHDNVGFTCRNGEKILLH